MRGKGDGVVARHAQSHGLVADNAADPFHDHPGVGTISWKKRKWVI
jgi:hypothetical protein